jgi:hypothetical protein
MEIAMSRDLQNHTVVKRAQGVMIPRDGDTIKEVAQLGTFHNVKVQAERKLAAFVADDTYRTMAEEAKYQGWCNTATWEFNLYFLQEEQLIQRLLNLRISTGKINYNRAAKLFHEAQCRNLMEQLSDDAEGSVNVTEIVDAFLAERRSS